MGKGKNSLTQIGLKEKLSSPITLSQISREFKDSGISRKQIKWRVFTTLAHITIISITNFDAQMLGYKSRNIFE